MSAQLTQIIGYNVKDMVFSPPREGKIPGGNMTYKRINVASKYANGSKGDFLFMTPTLFSFGVSENTGQDGKLNGYSLPLCLHNNNGATKEEKDWIEGINNIVEHTKDYTLENKNSIGKWDLERSDLKKMNPIYLGKRDPETGEIDTSHGPKLYAKLQCAKDGAGGFKIKSVFFNKATGEDMDPMELFGTKGNNKYCHVDVCLKLESIYIGAKISLQIKVVEVGVSLMSSEMPRLMSRVAPTTFVENEDYDEKSDTSHKSYSNANDEDNISISDDEFVNMPAPSITPPKAVAARRKVGVKN